MRWRITFTGREREVEEVDVSFKEIQLLSRGIYSNFELTSYTYL